MRTKLYVLGAVLGVAPGLLPVVSTSWGPPSQVSSPESRGSARKGRGGSRAGSAPAGNHAMVAPPPEEAPASSTPEEPRHPCELITFMKVPCDPRTATCEYTYWECPTGVKPLRA